MTAPRRILGIHRQGNGHFGVTILTENPGREPHQHQIGHNIRTVAEAQAFADEQAPNVRAYRVMVLQSARGH